jgi:hypothetical protein
VDEVGRGERAETADRDDREGHRGDGDARDEAGTQERGKVLGDLQRTRQHIKKSRINPHEAGKDRDDSSDIQPI